MITVKVVKVNSDFKEGRKTFNCPYCGEISSFYTYQDIHCQGNLCGEPLPDIDKILERPLRRLAWHKGGSL